MSWNKYALLEDHAGRQKHEREVDKRRAASRTVGTPPTTAKPVSLRSPASPAEHHEWLETEK